VLKVEHKIGKPANNIHRYHADKDQSGAPFVLVRTSFFPRRRRDVVLFDRTQLLPQNHKYSNVAEYHCYEWYCKEDDNTKRIVDGVYPLYFHLTVFVDISVETNPRELNQGDKDGGSPCCE